VFILAYNTVREVAGFLNTFYQVFSKVLYGIVNVPQNLSLNQKI